MFARPPKEEDFTQSRGYTLYSDQEVDSFTIPKRAIMHGQGLNEPLFVDRDHAWVPYGWFK